MRRPYISFILFLFASLSSSHALSVQETTNANHNKAKNVAAGEHHEQIQQNKVSTTSTTITVAEEHMGRKINNCT